VIAGNRAALAARFPELLAALERAAPPGPVEVRGTPRPTLSVAGLQLASGYDPQGEAALQAALVPRDAKRAACYGIGTGHLPRALLARRTLARLDVVLFHPGVARAVLERCDCADWLGDKRVAMALARPGDELAPPFAAAPACLRLAADGGARLRDQVFLELATPHLKRHVATRAGDLPARLAENRDLLERDGDAGALFGSRSGSTAYVAGAGPTLVQQLARLKGRARGEPLVAVDAALKPLLTAGVRPDFVVTLDGHRDHQLPFFAGDLSALAATPLVYAPSVHRDVLLRWPGPRCAFYERSARYAALARDLPRAVLATSGSVIHPAVDLAVRLGASEVRFAGMDFAHVGGRSHAAGSHHARRDSGADIRAGAWVLDGNGRRVPSLPNLVGYLRDLERYLARTPGVRFVNLSSAGARIAGAPHAQEAA
jgi:hypothetical protein